MAQWFEEYEKEPVVEKADIPWEWTVDFDVQGNYISNVLGEMRVALLSATDEQLLTISQRCFNLTSWVGQMKIMGFTGLPLAVEVLLEREFGNKAMITDLQKKSFTRWIANKSGQYKIGQNYFVIHDQKIYYRNLKKEWFPINESDVFHIFPELGMTVGPEIIQILETRYQVTPYDKVYQAWKQAGFAQEVPAGVFDTLDGRSNPEDYLSHSKRKIADLLNNPVALSEVEAYAKNDKHLEELIKTAYLMSEYVTQLRAQDGHTVYLLRDCLSFYEIHHTQNLVEGREASFDQLYIGRALMTNKKRHGGHWFFTQTTLFNVYTKHPNDFEKFYEEYSNTLSEYEAYSDEFRLFVADVTIYIKKHVDNALAHDQKITIVDLGFQGSINMFIKYVIDRHLCHVVPTAINVYVLAEWFKSLYKGMFVSDTYSLVTVIENLDRNERLFDYKMGSLDDGNVTVIMGTDENQKSANIELIVNTMVAMIMVQ